MQFLLGSFDEARSSGALVLPTSPPLLPPNISFSRGEFSSIPRTSIVIVVTNSSLRRPEFLTEQQQQSRETQQEERNTIIIIKPHTPLYFSF